jgi:hypothetical protein
MKASAAAATVIAVVLAVSACTAADPAGTTATATAQAPSASPASPVSGSATPGPSGSDACSLATLAEVSAAIHFTVNVQTIGGGGESCTWTFADPNQMNGFNTAKLELISPSIFAINQADQADATVTPVTGLGDAAVFVDAGADGIGLSVEKGSAAFTVSVLGIAYTPAQVKDDERALAAYVLARI